VFRGVKRKVAVKIRRRKSPEIAVKPIVFLWSIAPFRINMWGRRDVDGMCIDPHH